MIGGDASLFCEKLREDAAREEAVEGSEKLGLLCLAASGSWLVVVEGLHLILLLV